MQKPKTNNVNQSLPSAARRILLDRMLTPRHISVQGLLLSHNSSDVALPQVTQVTEG